MRVTVEDYAKQLGVSRSTAFRRLTKLVQEGKAVCYTGYVQHSPSNFSDVRMPPSGRINYYKLLEAAQ